MFACVVDFCRRINQLAEMDITMKKAFALVACFGLVGTIPALYANERPAGLSGNSDSQLLCLCDPGTGKCKCQRVGTTDDGQDIV